MPRSYHIASLDAQRDRLAAHGDALAITGSDQAVIRSAIGHSYFVPSRAHPAAARHPIEDAALPRRLHADVGAVPVARPVWPAHDDRAGRVGRTMLGVAPKPILANRDINKLVA